MIRLIMKKSKGQNYHVCNVVRAHFDPLPAHELVCSARVFPATARLDLQAALSEILRGSLVPGKQMGVHREFGHDTLTFAQLLVDENNAPTVAPLQYDEIDAGEAMPVRCLRNSLWLGNYESIPFALLLSRTKKYGESWGSILKWLCLRVNPASTFRRES